MTSTTLHYLSDPTLRALYLPGVAAGLALASLCAMLSVLVVLKRLAFVGQGVSHAAFGGVGLVVALGIGASASAAGTLGQFGVIFLFCLGAAVLVGVLAERGKTEADTAIGIVLVGSMALGAVLLRAAPRGVSWESFLFGDILSLAWADAALAWGVALGVGLLLVILRRPMLFWAFDPVVARAAGVRCGVMNLLLMAMLAFATVTAMKLAGVVLATALLVLPGAVALKLSSRWDRVLLASAFVAIAGALGGLVLSFEADWPPGASMVCVLAACFGVAAVWAIIKRS